MVFSSPTFLFVFLPVTFGVLALVRGGRLQNAWLLVMSAAFYLWGGGAAILILAGVCGVSYLGGFIPWARLRAGTEIRARLTLAAVIAVLLVPLITYKYIPPLSKAALGDGVLQGLVLPLGISFFTFHAISYTIDVYRGTVERERNLADYALYLFLFPHQIAGPIVRYAEIREELKTTRIITAREFGYGFSRFSWGLAKKVLVADQCGRAADFIFAANATGEGLSIGMAWFGAFMYTLQIYFDFSGYSDMAIGLAMILGFRFPENFNQPYRSISVTDFWRRWHMTLTRWFRDYVYIPLGGNRHGPLRGYAALVTVFLLTSLWHGGTASFLVWGGLHSAVLIIERITGIRKSARFTILRRCLIVVFITFSRVPFRSGSLVDAARYWGSMVAGDWGGLSPQFLTTVTPLLVIAIVIGVVSLIGSRSATGFGSVFGASSIAGIDRFRWQVAVPVSAVLLVLSAIMVLWSGFSPFLYFQF